MEIDRRDRRNRVDAQALGMSRQLHAVGGVVAGHMRDDHDASFCGRHDVFEDQLPLCHRLINALTGRAAHIQALHALADQVLGQRAGGFRRYRARFIVAGIEGREDALILVQILSHSILSPFF